MWEPVGPLPASVYWRRRLVALAVVAAVLTGLGWTVARLLSGDGTTTRVTSRASLSAPQSVVPSPSATPAPPAAVPAPQPVTPGQVPSLAAAVTTTGATASPASERLTATETRGPVAAATPVPVPRTGPVPCDNSMISVRAEIDRPQHRVGERPEFRLVIENVSGQPCLRDLDPLRQELVVWSGDGSTRLWSSNDCQDVAGTDLRTLVPRRPLVFSLSWAGRTTNPGCTAPRTTVPAGEYRLVSRLDDVISAPIVFVRLP